MSSQSLAQSPASEQNTVASVAHRDGFAEPNDTASIEIERRAPTAGTIVLVMSTGWGVRTFLQTNVLPRLLKQSHLVIFSSPELTTPIREELSGKIPVEPLRPFDHTIGDYGRTYERRNYYFRELSGTRARKAKLERYRETLRGRSRRLIRSRLLQVEARLFAGRPALSFLRKRERKLFNCDRESLPVKLGEGFRLTEGGFDVIIRWEYFQGKRGHRARHRPGRSHSRAGRRSGSG